MYMMLLNRQRRFVTLLLNGWDMFLSVHEKFNFKIMTKSPAILQSEYLRYFCISHTNDIEEYNSAIIGKSQIWKPRCKNIC